MPKVSSNTADNSKKKPRGRPFEKGDKRINRTGRPKEFTAMRDLAREIAIRKAQNSGGQYVKIDGKEVSIVEVILFSWATSGDFQKQKHFLEIAYGKVPDKIDLTSDGEKLPSIIEIVKRKEAE